MRPERVVFGCRPGTFRVEMDACDNFECPCTAVTFDLLEVRSRQRHAPEQTPLKIKFRVDVVSWQEVDVPGRSPLNAAMVAEFLQDYPEAERDLLRKVHQSRLQMIERLKVAVLDAEEVMHGTLFSFRDLLESPRDLNELCPLGEYWLAADGAYYLVSELYCTNPSCDCRIVRVVFSCLGRLGDKSRTRRTEDHFRASVSLDGEYRLDELLEIDRDSARKLMAQWREENQRELKQLEWRYDKMKEVGRRSLAAAPSALPRIDARPQPLRRTDERVGRNDPCPCGSGKKYKKCCARDIDGLMGLDPE